MKAIYDVIKRPLLTEKSMGLQESENTYCFEVNVAANKIEIKSAVEQMFGVKVADVRTAVIHGKVKRFGRSLGKRSNWKKAFVKLEGDSKLDFVGPTAS
jgi:large subunit ribosomal protein L23